MYFKIILTLFFIFLFRPLFSYNVEIQIDNYPSDRIYIHCYYGNTSKFIDSVISNNQKFTFNKSELNEGLYFITSFEDKIIAEFVIDSAEPTFSMQLDFKNPLKMAIIKDSNENIILQSYHTQMNFNSKLINDINNMLENYPKNSKDYNFLLESKEKVEKQSFQYQQDISNANPNSLVALLIRTAQEPVVNIDVVDEKTRKEFFSKYRSEYLKDFNFEDKRLLYINNFIPRLDLFLDKLIPQNEDTIIQNIKNILSLSKINPELNSYLKGYFIEKYYFSKLLIGESIFVNLVDTILNKNPDILPDKRQKYIEEAENLKPLLIGKIAPDIQNLIDKDANKVNLYNLATQFTVLYFFRPDCSSCKQSLDPLNRILKKYGKNGLSIIAICNKYKDQINECWDYSKINHLDNWKILGDPFFVSKYEKLYHVTKTPLIYLLDSNKKILLKDISAEQLEELIEQYIK